MTAWTDTLETFAADVEAFYEGNVGTRDVAVGLDEDLRHVRPVERRTFKDLLRVSNAARQLERLPEAGETYHVVMRGNFNSWDLIPAILTLAEPATIAELNIATLGFNSKGAAALIDLLDTGPVSRCTFLCAHYWKSVEGDTYDELAEALTTRGHRCLAMRCHAKIVLAELTDGRCLTIESSANLRSCRAIEQFTMTNDPPLLQFHRGWMKQVLDEATA